MLTENYDRSADDITQGLRDGKSGERLRGSAPTATAEFAKSQLKDWMKPAEGPLPKFLAKSGTREWYTANLTALRSSSVPSTGPLLLPLRPAVAALAAGNPCMLKLSEALLATDELLLEFIPGIRTRIVNAVVGARDIITNLLKLPFDFLFLTGSVGSERS